MVAIIIRAYDITVMMVSFRIDWEMISPKCGLNWPAKSQPKNIPPTENPV